MNHTMVVRLRRATHKKRRVVRIAAHIMLSRIIWIIVALIIIVVLLYILFEVVDFVFLVGQIKAVPLLVVVDYYCQILAPLTPY